jgi:tetratricopeptide (TPR) repeat protein
MGPAAGQESECRNPKSKVSWFGFRISDSPRPVHVAALLALLTLAALGHVCANGFVDYDDHKYVTQNDRVLAGLTTSGLWWALTTTSMVNWHPLTWMSFELDCTIYGGPRAWGFHLTNLLFHAANTALLFSVLWRMTGALWRSALVAALFALHPLHVESVAWISERKDVLSTFFGILTIGAYVAYVDQPHRVRYLAVLLTFGMSLMAKPMLVTLPAALLLFDYWPLGRWSPGNDKTGSLLSALVLEKTPLFALAAASSAITLIAQHAEKAGGAVAQLPGRIENALMSYFRYLCLAVWPSGLIPFYPYSAHGYPVWEVAAAASSLAGITLLAIAWRRRRPYLIVGWLWYLGTLVPVIGLVEVLGGQAMADRYTYVPLIGIFIIFSWGLGEKFEIRNAKSEAPNASGSDFDTRISNLGAQRLRIGAAVAAIGACLALSAVQVRYWKNDRALWNHTLQVDPDNYVAHAGLGLVLLHDHRPDLAKEHFAKAIDRAPRFRLARNNMGGLFAQEGKFAQAAQQFAVAVDIDPRDAQSRFSLGQALLKLGNLPEAELQLSEGLRLMPDNALAHLDLGLSLRLQGRIDEAVRHYEAALRLQPDYAEAHNNLGAALAQLARLDESAAHFQEAARLNPADAEACQNLGLIRSLQGKSEEAVRWYRRAVNLEPNNAPRHYGLAYALHEQGRLDEARIEYQRAVALDPQWPEMARKTAWRLATDPDPNRRNAAFALRLAQQACQATGSRQPIYLDAVAAAFAEANHFDEAVKTARQALELARVSNQPELADRLRAHLHQYEARQPFRDPNSTNER